MPVANIRWRDYDYVECISTVDELLNLADQDPYFRYPYPILKSMLHQEERPPGISVTMLLGGCLRCEVLKKFEPYTLDLEKTWPAWRGTAYHTVLENNARGGDITEVRFWASLPNGDELHGKPDIIRPLYHDNQGRLHVCIIDLKTTRRVPVYDKPWRHHVEQVMSYAWLVTNAHRWEAEGFTQDIAPRTWVVDSVGVWYVDDDQPKPLEVRQTIQIATKAGAKNPVKKKKIPHVWTEEETLAFLSPRYREVKEAFENYQQNGSLPPYPPGFRFISGWEHQYSGTAEMCVTRYIEEQRREDLVAAVGL